MEPLVLTFAFDDMDAGAPVSPACVGLAAAREFVREVEEFLRGDDKEIDTAALRVAVVDGSFALRTGAIAAAPGLVADLRRLRASELLEAMSARRRDVVLAWQKRARGARRIQYRIDASFLDAPVRVDAHTDFHADDADQWVRVERYVRGELLEIGGARNVNAHIRLPDGSTLQVDATREQLRSERENRLYKPVMVRFGAEFNVRTNAYRGARLIAFSDYQPSFDEKSLQRLTERGAKAWADIGDAAEWVESLRED
jgi:hypothetical protein